MTRVLVGASKAMRIKLASLLSAEPAFQVVGRFSISDALARLEAVPADVLVLDVESQADEASLPGSEAGDFTVGPALLILTDHAERFLAGEAFRSGVRAILPRRAKAEEIVAAIRASAAGLIVLHPDAVDSMRPHGGEPAELVPSDRILTAREIEVLRMIADGLGNKEIASRLGISDHTVKFHIGSIFAKLGASNRAAAVAIGIREGFILV